MFGDFDQFFYRATVRRYAVAERRIMRRADGLNEYAHVRVSIRPGAKGSGNVLSWHAGSQIPAEFAGFVMDGAASALRQGILGGIGFVDVLAIVEGGSYHEADSNGPAFREAAETATTRALRCAEPVLLEAVLSVSISVPEEFTGVVQGLIASCNEVFQDMSVDGKLVSLTTNLTVSKTHTFMSNVIENTQGTARFSFRIVDFAEARSGQPPQDDWAALT